MENSRGIAPPSPSVSATTIYLASIYRSPNIIISIGNRSRAFVHNFTLHRISKPYIMQRCAEPIRCSQAGFTLNVGLKDCNLGKLVWYAYVIGLLDSLVYCAGVRYITRRCRNSKKCLLYRIVAFYFRHRNFYKLPLTFSACHCDNANFPIYVSIVSQTSFVTSFNSLSRTPTIARNIYCIIDCEIFLFLHFFSIHDSW